MILLKKLFIQGLRVVKGSIPMALMFRQKSGFIKIFYPFHGCRNMVFGLVCPFSMFFFHLGFYICLLHILIVVIFFFGRRRSGWRNGWRKYTRLSRFSRFIQKYKHITKNTDYRKYVIQCASRG
ncbi:pCP123L [African swine fever virus]|uniref:PCP123L n=1 Tax=African swine fever virus TaxID=10497 RepID=A0A8A1UFG1_ASF|nr:pCP123L [African swine fever virus]